MNDNEYMRRVRALEPRLYRIAQAILWRQADSADAVQEALEDGRVDYVRIRTEVRERLGSFLWREMKRHPVILPVIMEVEV